MTRIENDNFKLAIAYVSGVIATWHATNGNRYTRRYIEIGEELTEES